MKKNKGNNTTEQKSMTTLGEELNEERLSYQYATENERLRKLHQVATASILAFDIWEDKIAAIDWLSRPNQALGGKIPLLICEDYRGTEKVLRVLNALKWGGPV